MPQQQLAEILSFNNVPVTVEYENETWSHSEEYIRASIFGIKAVLTDTQVRAWGAEVKRRNALVEDQAAAARAKASMIEKRIKEAKAVYRLFLAARAEEAA